MSANTTAVTAEYHRATQIGAARTIEKMLKRTDLPPVAEWSITPVGTVRGRIDLTEHSRSCAVAAVRAVHRLHGGTVAVRERQHAGRELVARIECALWDVELWAYAREPHSAHQDT